MVSDGSVPVNVCTHAQIEHAVVEASALADADLAGVLDLERQVHRRSSDDVELCLPSA
jgi:hypothetical protein